MNGYVRLETIGGEPVAVNVDWVSFVRRYRGGDDACAINFEKGNYIVVNGSIDQVSELLASG